VPSGRPGARGRLGVLGATCRDTDGLLLVRPEELGEDLRGGEDGAGRDVLRWGGFGRADGEDDGEDDGDDGAGRGATGRGSAGTPRLPTPWLSFFETV
jgi:hypothetical protein